MIVKGDVQGVNFRARVREKARQLGLTGFVKNMSDGTVYIEAEGDESAIERFVDWCRQDPGSSRVDDVRVHEGVPKGYTDFTIR
ncbi:MAG: acylphosphatase [Patescibacteria group bacterium]